MQNVYVWLNGHAIYYVTFNHVCASQDNHLACPCVLLTDHNRQEKRPHTINKIKTNVGRDIVCLKTLKQGQYNGTNAGNYALRSCTAIHARRDGWFRCETNRYRLLSCNVPAVNGDDLIWFYQNIFLVETQIRRGCVLWIAKSWKFVVKRFLRYFFSHISYLFPHVQLTFHLVRSMITRTRWKCNGERM